MTISRPACLIFLVLFLAPAPASAKPLYDKPVYHPESGNYFELVKVTTGHSIRGPTIPAVTWANAQRLAATRAYKGARGRLALVKSRAVNDFLRATFRPDRPAWIGLRYWCAYNRLQWVSGEFHSAQDYANWDRVWVHEGGTRGGTKRPSCDKANPYWPVHYWAVQDGFRWSANGTKKEFRAFFIEYPTGQE